MLRKTKDESVSAIATESEHPAGSFIPANYKVVRREAILALNGNGVELNATALLIGCSTRTVTRWVWRALNTNDLNDIQRSGCPLIYTRDIATWIVGFYCQVQPLPGCGRWTFRWAAAYLAAHAEQVVASPSKSTIHRIIRDNKLKPHLSRYFLHISDPNFFPKMEHLIALYMKPPANLYFFDECPGIQILKRLMPDMRTNEMKVRLEEFEYIRNGTMDVFAFMNNSDGNVYAECHADHVTTTFLGVFRRHAGRISASEKIHYVMDNLACHRGYPFCQLIAELCDIPCPMEKELNSQDKRVEWLQLEGKRIVIHFTPFHGSWLNQVEIWFGIMGGKLLSESFSGADALILAFDAFVEQWNLILAHPFNWTYDGKGLCEKAVKRFTAMLRNSVEQLDTRILTNMLMLMGNLLNDNYNNVSIMAWKELAETVESKREAMATLVEREAGPLQKNKAVDAMTAFNIALNVIYYQNLMPEKLNV